MDTKGTFSFVKCDTSRHGLTTTYDIVDKLAAWDDLADETDIKTSGLCRLILTISENKYDIKHTHQSWMYCINHMKKIADMGWDRYVLTWARRGTV